MKKERVFIAGISWASLFKFLFVSLACSIGVFTAILGILGAFDISWVTIRWNDEPVTGWMSIPISLGIGLLFSFISSLFYSILIGLGQWIWSRFTKLELWYKA